MASPSIQVSQVSKDFNGQTLLRDVSFTLNKGERLVLIGPSGQGKTVLLKVIAGLIDASRGQVHVEGESLDSISQSERQKIQLRMGMLFQKNALFDSMTVAENIAFPLREVKNMPEGEIRQKIDFFLEEVGIAHAKDLYPDEISGGMQKRLGIARALALDPEIILYDDPTAGLDPITSRKIIQLILKLQKEKNSTLIAITNEMNRAYQMAGKIAFIDDCQFILTGDEEQTKKSENPKVKQFITGRLEGPLTDKR